jgi:hypothetical protein
MIRDALLKDKNNVIDACNRFTPIVSDIEKIIAKGVSFKSGKIDSSSLSPWKALEPETISISSLLQKS